MIVAIQGERGSFSEEAVQKLVGPCAQLLCCQSFSELFDALVRGAASHAVVPVRNSIVGLVLDNHERVIDGAYSVLSALQLPVRQCLIVRPNMKIQTISRVASHAVALQQCSQWFAKHPHVVAMSVADTAGAVRDLMLGTLSAEAAIASVEAARFYSAEVLVEGVEDRADNVTEFLLIKREL